MEKDLDKHREGIGGNNSLKIVLQNTNGLRLERALMEKY
jgi:hypothetical protein